MASKVRVRLQRFLAQAGVASRRRAEQLILDGRVTVNGRVVRELGTSVDPDTDEICFEGSRVQLEDRVWLLLNKPPGAITTVSDPEGRQTVLDLIGNQGVRLYPVGRLDYNTEGVLLLTNDGELANALMHPSHKVPRTYRVKLKGIIDPDDLQKLRDGIALDGQQVSAEGVHVLGTTEKNTWIEMTIRQGLNRQVHRMLEAIGGSVLRLVRISYAGITSEGLRQGEYRALTQSEVDELRSTAGLKHATVRAEAVLPGRRSRGTLDRPRRTAGGRGSRARGDQQKRRPGKQERRKEEGAEEKPSRRRRQAGRRSSRAKGQSSSSRKKSSSKKQWWPSKKRS